MSDREIPQPVGDTGLPPIPLTSKMANLCARLDALSVQNQRTSLPSDMVRGAVFVARSELHSNPDWIAQAAHSLRDTLYPFLSKKSGIGKQSTIQALKQYGSVKDPNVTVPKMGRLFGELSDVAHHGKVLNRTFEDLLAEFELVLADALGRQSDIHAEIDEILSLNPYSI
jgi:hypothetical protein